MSWHLQTSLKLANVASSRKYVCASCESAFMKEMSLSEHTGTALVLITQHAQATSVTNNMDCGSCESAL